MNFRPLGTTGLSVTPIGLGLAALGRPGYVNLGHAEDLNHNYDVSAMQGHTHAMLDAAWEEGIRYFDTARSYGRAEEFLGNWLRGRAIHVGDVTVGSKWGYTYTADWQVEAEHHEIKDHTLSVLQRQWGETQTHLGDYVQLYQIHSATPESGVLMNYEVLNQLARLKNQGLKIGLTLSGPDQVETLRMAMAIQLDGLRLFDCVQATYNLLETSAAPALKEAHAAGMGVVIKEALANGRLTPRNHDPEFADTMRQLKQQANRLNTTLDGLALAAVVHQSWVDVVLSGAATLEHLHANLKALEVEWDEEVTSELGKITEPPSIYWKRRKTMRWN
ncbi:MAG: aldo/keto reductase [Anaerolineae bacterium]|nr:MAG: aldo/keto reductase [Anaerolineae bacterium]